MRLKTDFLFDYSQSYRKQIRYLSEFATAVVNRFPVRVRTIRLIDYGANATFKVCDFKGQCFALKIFSAGYQSENALNEQLHWLQQLNMQSIFT